jgi:AAA ATPase domain
VTNPIAPAAFNQKPALIGRQRDMTQLWQRFEAAAAGQMTIALVGGEPGIGKTRLLDEVAAQARADGARVLRGAATVALSSSWMGASANRLLRLPTRWSASDTPQAFCSVCPAAWPNNHRRAPALSCARIRCAATPAGRASVRSRFCRSSTHSLASIASMPDRPRQPAWTAPSTPLPGQGGRLRGFSRLADGIRAGFVPRVGWLLHRRAGASKLLRDSRESRGLR